MPITRRGFIKALTAAGATAAAAKDLFKAVPNPDALTPRDLERAKAALHARTQHLQKPPLTHGDLVGYIGDQRFLVSGAQRFPETGSQLPLEERCTHNPQCAEFHGRYFSGAS